MKRTYASIFIDREAHIFIDREAQEASNSGEEYEEDEDEDEEMGTRGQSVVRLSCFVD